MKFLDVQQIQQQPFSLLECYWEDGVEHVNCTDHSPVDLQTLLHRHKWFFLNAMSYTTEESWSAEMTFFHKEINTDNLEMLLTRNDFHNTK